MKNFSSVFGNNVIECKFSFAKGGCFKNQRNAGPLFFIYIYFPLMIPLKYHMEKMNSLYYYKSLC